MNRKALNTCVIAVAAALALGAVGGPASALQDGSRKQLGQPKYEDMTAEKKARKSAAEAEARINKSESAKAAMAEAARAGNMGRAKRLLIENGFTPDQLERVPIRFEQAGGGGGGGAERIKSVEIKVKCCPLEITIIIKF